VHALSRVRHEALLSCWWHGTCLSFDFQGIDRGRESHDGCDQKLLMAERCFGGNEDGRDGSSFAPGVWYVTATTLARGGDSPCVCNYDGDP
jgi:hypothetical protein